MNSLLSKEFVPLYTALSWIAFWSIVLIVARSHLSSAIEALLERVRGGSSLTVGLFKLEGVPKEVRAGSTGVVAVSDTAHPEAIPSGMKAESINAEYQSLIKQYFLLHAAEVISPPTSPRSGRYRVRVWIESYNDQHLKEISRVTYRVWDDANQSIISTTSHRTNFELWMSVYGEFPVLAYVERKGKEAVWVNRYLDLPGRPTD